VHYVSVQKLKFRFIQEYEVSTQVVKTNFITNGHATMVHGRGCNPHRCTTTFANVEI